MTHKENAQFFKTILNYKYNIVWPNHGWINYSQVILRRSCTVCEELRSQRQLRFIKPTQQREHGAHRLAIQQHASAPQPKCHHGVGLIPVG